MVYTLQILYFIVPVVAPPTPPLPKGIVASSIADAQLVFNLLPSYKKIYPGMRGSLQFDAMDFRKDLFLCASMFFLRYRVWQQK